MRGSVSRRRWSAFIPRSAAIVLVVLVSLVARAQTNWFERQQAIVTATQMNQPHWATPLVTTNARIEQGFRADFIRQSQPSGKTTWNYGNTQGLQIIPFARTELRVSLPAFMTHSDRKAEDGFGDFAFRIKIRLYGSNESHHNAIVSALLPVSIPTGKEKNGSCCVVLSPTLEFGKGFRRLTSTTSFGGTFPASNAKVLGRSVVINEALQYHVTKLLWMETELNATLFEGGRSGGQKQLFATPGVVVSRIPLKRPRSTDETRLALSLGLGEQTALTPFHAYNNAPIFTGRLRF